MFGLQSAALIHLGQKRKNNEDYVTFFEPTDSSELQLSGCLYVLADGVGGAARGERASQYAADKVVYEYYERPQVEPSERLRQAIASASADIFAYSLESTRVTRMATTIVAAAVRGNMLYAANVGDSRLYLIRGGQALQLTDDHSVVGEMVVDGQLTEEQAMASRVKNRLTRSVGGESDVHVQLYDPVPLQQGDRLLMCSDGLTRYANRQKISEIASQGNPEEIANRCIQFANAHGGADNISVIAVAVGAPLVGPPNAAMPRPHLPTREVLEDAPTDPFAARGALARSGPARGVRPTQRGLPSSTAMLVSVLVVVGALTLGALLIYPGAMVSRSPTSVPTTGPVLLSDSGIVPPPGSGTETPSPSPEPTTTVTATVGVSQLVLTIIANPAYLRRLPTFDNDSKYTVPGGYSKGQTLTATARTADGKWFLAADEKGNQGWLYIGHIQISEQAIGLLVITPTEPEPAPTPPTPGEAE